LGENYPLDEGEPLRPTAVQHGRQDFGWRSEFHALDPTSGASPGSPPLTRAPLGAQTDRTKTQGDSPLLPSEAEITYDPPEASPLISTDFSLEAMVFFSRSRTPPSKHKT